MILSADISKKKKILLHLLSMQDYLDSEAYPVDVTQKGMSNILEIPQPHISKSLKRYTDDGLIIEKKGRIERSERTRKVYFLSAKGLKIAEEIEKSMDKPPKFDRLIQIMENGKKGSPKEMIPKYEEALVILKKWGEDEETLRKKIEILSKLGDAYYIVGNLEMAVESWFHLLEVSIMLDDKKRMAEGYRNIGKVQQIRNRWLIAKEHFDKALEISQKIDDKAGSAEACRNLGMIYRKTGKYGRAIKHFEKCVRNLDEEKEGNEIASIYVDMGNCYDEKGEKEKAMNYYEKSLQILKETRDKYRLARSYANIGILHIYQLDFKKALPYFEKCIKIGKETGYVLAKGYGLAHGGHCYIKLHDLEKGKEYCDEALQIFERLIDRNMIAGIYMNYGIYFGFKGNWKTSEKYFLKALTTSRGLNLPITEAMINHEFGLMLKDKGNVEEAKKYLKKAMDLWKKAKNKKRVEIVKTVLADVQA